MSFGIGVGDVIALCTLARQVRGRFVDSPSQFKAISEEVKNLSHILLDLEVVLNERSLTEPQKAKLHSLVEGCRNVLGDLDKVVEKYQSLGNNPKGLGGRSQRLWKKLKWEPDDIQELRSCITSNISLVNLFNGSLINNLSQATKDGVDLLNKHLNKHLDDQGHRNKHQDEQERDQARHNIEDWLSSADFVAQQTDVINRRQEGTGQWLLDSEKFKNLLDGTQQTLFCYGIPGAGKTIITSTVVEHLWSKFQADNDTGIAYLYCNYNRQQEQRFGDLVASLLKQLLERLPDIPNDIKNLHQRHRARRTRPDDNELSVALHSVLASRSRTFFIIDALDECINSDRTRKRLLSEIFKYQSLTTVSLFATSRRIPEITSVFPGEVSMEIRATEDDVQLYLDNHITQLPNCILKNQNLQTDLKAEIVRAVDGMFLLAQLYLDSFKDKLTSKAVRTALQRLPKGSEALDIAYKEALKRVESQKEGFKTLARRVLSWITHARRSLTILELQHALAVEIGESELDEENICEAEEMVSVCAGLVTSDQETGVIRLVHYTTQEFFKRIRLSWAPEAQSDIAMTCLTYLNFDTFETGPCDTLENFEARLQQNVFLDYAAKNWGHHAHMASEERVNTLALDFLSDNTKVACCSQAAFSSSSYLYESDWARKVTGIHLAAYFGFEKSILALLEDGCISPDSRDEQGQTPLAWAAECGHESVVKLLIEWDGLDKRPKDIHSQMTLASVAQQGKKKALMKPVNINSKDKNGNTPLSQATSNGNVEIVNLLLMKRYDIEINSKIDSISTTLLRPRGQTPLAIAASEGQLEILKLLIKQENVEINSVDEYDDTPLANAAFNGHLEIVKVLIKREHININWKNNRGQTPLAIAARNRHLEIVKVLIEREDVEINSKDRYGSTPLAIAVFEGELEIVKSLVERHDVEINSVDQNGDTPLANAALNGHLQIVKLLIERDDVEMNSKNRYGRTPLANAALKGHLEIVKVLIKKDVEINSVDQDGGTPLANAALNGHLQIVKLLIERDDVEMNSKNGYGRTPLANAALNGHLEIVKVLIERDDVEMNSKNGYGRTPLANAALNGHLEIVKVLIKKDVEIDSVDQEGGTPLANAALNGHLQIVKLLIERGDVEINSKDRYGRTLLDYAALNGHLEIVVFLIERDDVEINLEKRDSKILLRLAALHGNVKIVKLLIEQDFNISSVDEFGNTPLANAALNGHLEIVKLLIERDDVIINSKNISGRTPLANAALEGHLEIVKLLIKPADAEINTMDRYGHTPLAHAALKGHLKIVKLLIGQDDVEINSKAKDGNTPLANAALNGHLEIVKLLIERDDIIINSKNNSGQTPLAIAAFGGYLEIVKLLIRQDDVDANSVDQDGSTPLANAALNGYLDIVKLLIERNDVKISPMDRYDRTPLGWAVKGGHLEVVELLLKQDKIILDQQDYRGKTLMDLARGHKDISKLLMNHRSSTSPPT